MSEVPSLTRQTSSSASTWQSGDVEKTVLAERIVTMIDRGGATTRERDLADVALLLRHDEIDESDLGAAINATGAHRGSELQPLREVLISLGRERQDDWARFIRRSRIEDLSDFYDDTITRDVVNARLSLPANVARRGSGSRPT